MMEGWSLLNLMWKTPMGLNLQHLSVNTCHSLLLQALSTPHYCTTTEV